MGSEGRLPPVDRRFGATRAIPSSSDDSECEGEAAKDSPSSRSSSADRPDDELPVDLTAGSLMASLLVSSIGLALFLFGKREVRLPQLVAGLTMMVFPYFVTDPLPMLGIAAALVLALVVVLRAGG